MHLEANDTEDTRIRIAKSAGSVSIAVFASRILGLVREQVFAGLFGAGLFVDAFVVAFRIPNLLRDLFAEGALSSAFVTVFTDCDNKKGRQEAFRLANNLIVALALILVIVILLGIAFSQNIINLMAPDFAKITGKMALTRKMANIMFPFLFLISLAAVAMGILNTMGRFFIPSIASAFFNLGSIVGGVSLYFIMPYFGQPPIVGMAIGILIGGMLQLAIQMPSLSKVGFKWMPRLDFGDEGLRRIMILMVPAAIGLSATQINIFINTYFAASCAQGSVSWLNYAFRLMYLPIGLFGVAISIAALPVISKHASNNDMKNLKSTYTSSIVLAFMLTIPASFGLAFLSEPIIRLIFEHGRFTSYDTAKTAEALVYYAIGLFAYSSVKITVPVFYALRDTKYPVIGSFMAVALNILIISLTIEYFQHKAIALSTSVTMIVNFLFLAFVLYKKVEGYDVGYLIMSVAKITGASVIMGFFSVYVNSQMTPVFGQGIMGDFSNLIITIFSAILMYLVLLYILRLKECTSLIKWLLRRSAFCL